MIAFRISRKQVCDKILHLSSVYLLRSSSSTSGTPRLRRKAGGHGTVILRVVCFKLFFHTFTVARKRVSTDPGGAPMPLHTAVLFDMQSLRTARPFFHNRILRHEQIKSAFAPL